MAQHASKPKLYLVFANDLDSVYLDEDEKAEGAETLMDLLQAPVADALLEALRRSISLTYRYEMSSEKCLRKIRNLLLEPAGDLGTELEALDLPRIDADSSYKRENRAQLCSSMIVPAKELRRKVRVEGERRKPALEELFEHVPADPILRGARRIISMTFEEATTPRQQDRIVEDIRFAAAEVLVPCNAFLEAAGVEPVAMPTDRRFIDGVDTCEDT